MIYYKRRASWKRLFLKLSEVNLSSLNFLFAFLKIISSVFIFFIILIYSSYLFLLPKYVTDEKVECYLNNYLKENSRLSLDIQNLKVKPDYKFDIKLSADSIIINYPNKKAFVSLDKADIEIDLFTLFFKYIDLNKIKTKKITINTNFTKNHHYNCFDYVNFDIFDIKNSDFNLRNIKIICDELVFNLYDENIRKNYQLKTNKLVFSSSSIDKPVIIETKGTVSSNKKISDFKLNLEIITNKKTLNNLKEKISGLSYNPLIQADLFKFYADLDIDLKIKNNNTTGKINLSNLSFVIDNIQIPKNNFSLIFKGQKIKVLADFNFIKNQFAKIDLNLDYSKNKFIEAKINSNEIDLSDLRKILGALIKIFNLKYNPDLINIEGLISADVYLKSNFKTIISNGFINVKDAKLKDKFTGLTLNDINSDINFDNNKINIKNTSAFVDNSKFYLTGNIDNNANLDLKINSDLINIAQILNTLRHIPFLSHIIPKLNDYVFESGFVKVNALITSNINTPIIKTNSVLTNLKLHIKPLNCFIDSKEVLISANPEGTAVKDIYLTAKNNIIKCANNKITNNIAKLKISDNDIIIDRTDIIYEKIKANIIGVIKNYRENPILEINLNTTLPLNNNLIVIKNKSPNVSADILIDKDKLQIKKAEISQNSKTIVLIQGIIDNYISNNPAFDNLKISIIDRISCILPKFDNLAFETVGDITVFGKLNNPLISGSVKLYNVICKKYDLFIKDCDLTIKNSNLEGSILSLDILQTTLDNVIFKGNLEGDNLKIANFSADIFQGRISGNANINLKNFKTQSELVLKEISVRHLSGFLKQYSIAVSGRLSAFMRLNFTGLDYESVLNSLNGYIKFNVNNGELAQFAKLERFLQAGNILSQSILKLTLNSIVSSVTRQNTGDFNVIEGTIKLNSPMANIQYINTEGTNMSLHIEGNYNIISNHAILRVLGRIPQNIVSVMGNIGKFSLSQLFDSNPSESAIEKIMSIELESDDIDKIPSLANHQANSPTREFIVLLDGLLNNNSAVKYFKWIYKN